MEAIAIIGFSLRFPQDAVSPESFWNLLVKGRSTVTEVLRVRARVSQRKRLPGLARYRVARGLKCVSLNLGLILSMGYAAEKKEVTQALKAAGHEGITEAEPLALLDCVCDPAFDNTDPDDAQIVTGLPTPGSLRSRDLDIPSWMTRPLFRPLYEMDRLDSGAVQMQPHKGSAVDYANLLSTADSFKGACTVALEALVKKLSKILFVAEEDVDTGRPMSVLGIDSLVAIEIRHWLASELKSDVPVLVILGNESISQVSRYVVERTQLFAATTTS